MDTLAMFITFEDEETFVQLKVCMKIKVKFVFLSSETWEAATVTQNLA